MTTEMWTVILVRAINNSLVSPFFSNYGLMRVIRYEIGGGGGLKSVGSKESLSFEWQQDPQGTEPRLQALH